MKEVEVKVKLKNKDEVIEKLKALGCVLSRKVQNDVVFFPNDIKDLSTRLTGRNFLRIREQIKDGVTKYIFTLKQPQLNDFDCIEYETEISDPENLARALKLMGYYEFTRVNKVRDTGKVSGYEICLDEVEGLGSFMELEALGEEIGDSLKIQEELYLFLEQFGAGPEDKIEDGYDVLMYKKAHGSS